MLESMFGPGNYIVYAGPDPEDRIGNSSDDLMDDYNQIVATLENIQKGVCYDDVTLSNLTKDFKLFLVKLKESEIKNKSTLANKLEALISETGSAYEEYFTEKVSKLGKILLGNAGSIEDQFISKLTEVIQSKNIFFMASKIDGIIVTFNPMIVQSFDSTKFYSKYSETQEFARNFFRKNAESEFKKTFEDYLICKSGSICTPAMKTFYTELAKRISMLHHIALQFKMPFIESYKVYMEKIETEESIEPYHNLALDNYLEDDIKDLVD